MISNRTKFFGLVFALSVLSFACTDDKQDSNASNAPGAGALSFSAKTATSVTVTWPAATTSTSAATLQYELVYSPLNNVDTAANAQAHGTVVLPWTAATLTANVTGLTAATTYYFAALVKDTNGAIGIANSSVTTLCSGKIIFLASVPNGNFGGSTGADTICNNNKPSGFSGSTFKALLGDNNRHACYISGNDSCSPSNTTGRLSWPLTANETLCTSDYSKVIGTTNASAYLTANSGVLSSVLTSTYTGMNIAWGVSTADNCSNFASSSGPVVVGDASLGGQAFYASNQNTFTCAQPGTVYCVEQ